MSLKKYINQYYNKTNFIAYILISIIVGAIPATAIIVRARLIDSATLALSGQASNFVVLLISFCAIYLFEAFFKAFTGRLRDVHKIKQSKNLDNMRLLKAARVKYALTESNSFHQLLNKAKKAVDLDSGIYQSIGDVVCISAKIVFSVVTICFIDVYVSIGIIILLLIGIFLNRILAKTTDGFWTKYMENMRRTNYYSDLLMQKEYMAERKLFNYDDELELRYDREFTKAKKQNSAAGRKRFIIELLLTILFAVNSAVVILLLINPMMTGKISLGEFISCFYASVTLQSASKQLCAGVFTITENGKQLNGFFEFINLQEEVPAGVSDIGAFDKIVFNNVTFTYPGAKKPVIKKLNLTLYRGNNYALVGENGCGKTTIVKLMLGLYTPEEGNITINGYDVSKLSTIERKRIFGVVFQDYYRYPLTIRENVSLYNDDFLSDTQISQVFDKLDMRPEIAKGDKGYDSNLMQLKKDGTDLSGGEWQKIAITRCMLSPASLVVLDEPNAALDPVSEGKIYRAYRELLSDKTTLFISHRLGSVRFSNEIIVLKDGKLLAQGTHKELMSHCEYYNKLYCTQKEMYDEKKSL